MTTPPRHSKDDDESVVDIKVPTSALNSLFSARYMLPIGAAALAGFGGFSARGAVESCPQELTDRLVRMESRIEGVDNRVESLDRRFDRLDTRLDRLSRRIEDIAKQDGGDPLAYRRR